VTAPVVTCDVFSALTDSHTGATQFLAGLRRDWPVAPEAVATAWDTRTKELHRLGGAWRPHAALAAHALTATYQELGLVGDPAADCQGLLASMAQWPLWPDVAALDPDSWTGLRVGLLSNTDDALLRPTAAARLPMVETDLVVTSETLQAYKPATVFYRRARERIGPYVHVAASARDVRGALEAGVPCVRLARPGHAMDPDGPTPVRTVSTAAELPAAILGLVYTHAQRSPSPQG
jgi:2-haloacid dehalogenase